MAEINLYEDLDQRIADATRNAEGRQMTSSTSIGTVAVDTISDTQESLTELAERWANAQLFEGKKSASASWDVYRNELAVPVPKNLQEFRAMNPNLHSDLEFLLASLDKLWRSKEYTHGHHPIAGDMQLVLIPWQDLSQAVDVGLGEWVSNLLHLKADATRVDDINTQLLSRFLENDEINGEPMYWDQTELFVGQKFNKQLSLRDYISHQLEHSGPWGVMLMQTGKIPGTYVQNSSERMAVLENLAERPLLTAGVNVSAMGPLEWLSLILQDPSLSDHTADIGSTIHSVLPAAKPNQDSKNERIYWGYIEWDILQQKQRYEGIIRPSMTVVPIVNVMPTTYTYPRLAISPFTGDNHV